MNERISTRFQTSNGDYWKTEEEAEVKQAEIDQEDAIAGLLRSNDDLYLANNSSDYSEIAAFLIKEKEQVISILQATPTP